MFLKSPDPAAYAVIHEGRLYPVRDGVFLIPADLRSAFPSFETAGEVSAEAADELARLGSFEQGSGSAAEDANVAASEAGEAVELVAEPSPATEPEAEAPRQADAKPRRSRAKKTDQ